MSERAGFSDYDIWKTTPPDYWDEDEPEDDGDDDEPDEEDEWVLACGYSGCCMPAYHYRSECHNAEDMEAMEAEYSVSLNEGQSQC